MQNTEGRPPWKLDMIKTNINLQVIDSSIDCRINKPCISPKANESFFASTALDWVEAANNRREANRDLPPSIFNKLKNLYLGISSIFKPDENTSVHIGLGVYFSRFYKPTPLSDLFLHISMHLMFSLTLPCLLFWTWLSNLKKLLNQDFMYFAYV